MKTTIETIIGIPGRWKNKSEIVTEIASKSDGYIFVGDLLLNNNEKELYRLEIYEYDQDLPKSFMYAGNFTDDQLKNIGEHNSTIYLIAKSGNLNSISSINKAVCGLLKAGGLAVKVESSGVAHTSDEWFQLAYSGKPEDVVNAYVTILEDGKTYYSCGMHNLGYRDAIITTASPSENAGYLISAFLSHVLSTNTELKQDEIFILSPNSPKYLLEQEECKTYEEDDLFFNPFGYWRLREK